MRFKHRQVRSGVGAGRSESHYAWIRADSTEQIPSPMLWKGLVQAQPPSQWTENIKYLWQGPENRLALRGDRFVSYKQSSREVDCLVAIYLKFA